MERVYRTRLADFQYDVSSEGHPPEERGADRIWPTDGRDVP
jgi:hypothetical protein